MTTVVRAWRIDLPNENSSITNSQKIADWYKERGCPVTALVDVDPRGDYVDGLLAGYFKAGDESRTRIEGLEKEIAELRHA